VRGVVVELRELTTPKVVEAETDSLCRVVAKTSTAQAPAVCVIAIVKFSLALYARLMSSSRMFVLVLDVVDQITVPSAAVTVISLD
jgi:vacuolar-type H+-ATPase subunit B/Vma2